MKFGKRKHKLEATQKPPKETLAVTGLDPVASVEAVCIRAFSAGKDFKVGDSVQCDGRQFKAWKHEGYICTPEEFKKRKAQEK